MTHFIRIQYYGILIDTGRKHWASIQAESIKLTGLLKELEMLEGDERNFFEFENVKPIRSDLTEQCITVIVLCALAIEGYIYDYAARKLSDSFVEHLDKLDAVSKWIVIPQLITGKKFPKDGKAFQLLKQLVADRNYLAHPKSASFFVYDQNGNESISPSAERMNKFSASLYDKAKNAILAIDELSLVIEKLDPDEPASFFLDTMVGKRKEQIEKYGA